MAAPAPRSIKTAQYGRYAADDYDDDDDYAPNPTYKYQAPAELEPGERIGRPLVNARRRIILKSAVVCALALSGGWAWLNYRATLMEWAEVVAAAVSPALERKAQIEPIKTPPPLQPLAVSEPAPGPVMPEASSLTTATLSPSTAAADDDAAASRPEKLPPPIADPADPYQTRALAVGLHPGLSRVLLAKLSPTDYRNAGIAIKTALAETPDTDVYIWPRQLTPELALFQVKFVPGAVADCRRYVVMVTKDGWLTTALPMEKCGIRPKDARK